MKNSKIILLIIIILFIVTFGIYGFINRDDGNIVNNNVVKPTEVIVPKFQTVYQLLDICNSASDENCKYQSAAYYRIDDKNNNSDFKPIIKDINNYYLDRIEEVKKDLLTSSECSEVLTTYKYRYYDEANIYYYVNDKIAVVTQYMQTTDLCTRKKTNPKFIIYYYDVEWQRFTDEDGMLKLIDKKRSEIESKLIPSLINKKLVKDKSEFVKLLTNKEISYKLFIDMVGNLIVGYNDNRDGSYLAFLLYTSGELGLSISHSE